jgi:cytidylate kinase
MIIAIDGPAGSGKSTVSKRLARTLGLLYIDTGAMYRALTLKALRRTCDLTDEQALARLARETHITLDDAATGMRVLLDGEDVSGLIRTQELTAKVWHVAQVAAVRERMVALQRELALNNKKGVVLEGRDIGTVVFPDADFKFYLDASFETRAERRHKELREKSQVAKIEEVQHDLRERDRRDMTRKVGPLKKTAETISVDTTAMSIDEVVAALIAHVKGRA